MSKSIGKGKIVEGFVGSEGIIGLIGLKGLF